jgi:excinuclease UvrABC helicase subunit UvrB
MNNITLSALPKTWIIDVDGTIVKHNGHLGDRDDLLDGVKEFFAKIAAQDKIILLTARKKIYEEQLVIFLKNNGIRFDQIICDLPTGERIILNDKKPSGLKTAYAINVDRDAPLEVKVKIDKSL